MIVDGSTDDLRRESQSLRLRIAELRERRAEIEAELCRRATRVLAKQQGERRKASIPNPVPFNERAERDMESESA